MNTPNDTPQTEISLNKMQADLLAILLKSAPAAQAASSVAAKPMREPADVAAGTGEASASLQAVPLQQPAG